MLIVFRADANPVIGTGHIMRCLALAGALARRGTRCQFLCREKDLGDMAERIRRDGHDLALIPEATNAPPDELRHAGWLPHGQAADADACRAILAGRPRPDWLVVDHYAIDHRWESDLRPLVGHILAIDDLADRRHDCDLLLDQNLRPEAAADPYAERVPAHCRRLLGPFHALLRPQFAAARDHAAGRPGSPPRLLVMFGGADRDDLTGRTVKLIVGLGLNLPSDVVIGPLYAHRQELERTLEGLPQATLHTATDDVATLMAGAGLAIASPGTTSWERCALGLPAITLAVADNQTPLAEALARRGAHLFLGQAGTVADADLAAAIRLLCGNDGWRQAMADAAAAITDGRGAERVARVLTAGKIGVRPATPDDARRLHQWRDDPRVRRQSFDPAPIPWERHLAWFEQALCDPARVILVGEEDGTAIGCVRFDLAGEDARVSVYLDPDRQGGGLATPLLLAADAWLQAAHPESRRRVAEVRDGNEASRHAFLGAGYHLDHSVFVKRG